MSNITKIRVSKTASVIVSFTAAVWLSGAAALMPIAASAATVDELQAQISALLAQISQLQTQLGAIQGGSAAPSGYTFSADLKMGSKGTDVTNLQTVLKSDASVYPEGLVTGYFGAMTKAAVIKFQNKYASDILTPVGLTNGTGYVGAGTRAKLNALYGGGVVTTPTTPTTPTVPGTGLTVSAATQPTATLAVQSASRLPFTKVTLTAGSDGDVTVSGIVIERTGLASDAVFSGIVLLDEDGSQLGIEKTLNSDHKATIGDSFVVKAGQSRTMTIAGNMVADNSTRAGQVAFISVTGVNTSATVSGTLPITGAGHTINATLSIGSVTMAAGATDPGSNQTSKEIGTTGYTFSSVRITAGSAEKIRIKSIRWNQSGSAASADLANIKTYDVTNAKNYDTTVSSDGKYYTATFGDGIVVDKGGNVEIAIKGDIAGGSARTIDFDIYKRTDIYVVGETYGYGIIPPNGTDSSGTDDGAFHLTTNPWFDAYQVTVSNGTLNVQKCTSGTLCAAQNLSINLSNQALGGFTVEAKGEAISVANMVFHFLITGTAGQVADITSVSLYDENGTVVAGPQDGSGAAVYGTVTFADTVTFSAGKKTYILKGKLGTDFTNNQTIQASTTPSTDWTSVTGQTTGNSITPSPTSAVSANTMTVKSTALAISASADPIAQTVVSGGVFTFANYRFDASASGEDIRMSSVPLAYDGTGAPASLTSCQLYDGATALNSGSNILNPSSFSSSTTFTFDGTGLTVAKGTIKNIALKCDIAGNATTSSTYAWGVDASATFNGTGLSSGQSFTPTATDSMGQLMTMAANGTLTVALDSSSSSYTIVAAGTTDTKLSVLKFHAATEAITLQKIALQLSGTASNSPQDLVKVTLWDGSTKVGEAVFTTTDYATSTLSTPVLIPKDGDKVITIKGDLAAIGISAAGTEGALIKVDYDNDDSTGTQGVGVNSGVTINRTTSADSSSSGIRMFKSYPTLAKLTVPSTKFTTGTNTMDLYRFSVKADPASGNGIGLYKFVVSVATSSASAVIGTTTVDTLKVYGYTDASCSTLIGGSFTNGQVVGTITGLVAGNNVATTTAVVEIPAGSTYCFRVVGDVTFTAGTSPSGSVGTKIKGDAAYTGLSTQMGLVAGIATSNFIWSPFATTTSATTTHYDWTNGYYVAGLPSTDMDIQTISY